MAGIALYTDRSDEWATPDKLFEELNNEFGFTLDPCSNEQNFKCKNIILLMMMVSIRAGRMK